MKKRITLGIFMLAALVLNAQNLLNQPQKIVIDKTHNRYLVSMWQSAGDLVAIDIFGNQSYFVENAGMVDGMEIVGDTVYGSGPGSIGNVRGYALETGEMVMDINMSAEGVNHLSSFVQDSNGIIFTSERFGTRIFKINPATQEYWVFAEGNGIVEPNGLLYEPEYNRLLVCLDQPNPPILAISLTDSTVSTVTTTNLPGSDGIAKDKYGHYYITGYELPGIYKFDPDFTGEPELFFVGNYIIYPTYHEEHHSLLITYYYQNTWGEVFLSNNLLNNPESVVYDQASNSYLVSNCGDGHIIRIDNLGQQSYFNTQLTYTLGLHIVGDTLFVSSNADPYTGVVGFLLSTGELIFYVEIPEKELLNDITSDQSGNLYVTDCDANKIFKVNINTMSYTTFVDSGLGYPNGIMFDETNNRLLVLNCLLPNRPMLSVNLEDSTLSMVVETGISSIDGLTSDNYGNVYFSSWTTDKIYRYDQSFTNPPEVISSGHNDPADIFFNKLNNVLAIPNYSADTVEFIPILFTGQKEIKKNMLSDLKLFPNPFSDNVTLSFFLHEKSPVRVVVCDILGNRIKALKDEVMSSGEHMVVWKGKNNSGQQVADGTYFLEVSVDDLTEIRKTVLLKR